MPPSRAIPVSLGPSHSSTPPRDDHSTTPSSPPPASSHPSPDHAPESAIRTQLEALRQNNHPEPNSGIATVHAFQTDSEKSPTPVPWPKFARDFDTRLRRHLLGFTAARLSLLNYTPQSKLIPNRATYRVDLEHADSTSALAFHLIQLPVVGSRPTWFTTRITVLDTS